MIDRGFTHGLCIQDHKGDGCRTGGLSKTESKVGPIDLGVPGL